MHDIFKPFTYLFLILSFASFSQDAVQRQADSIHRILSSNVHDTVKVRTAGAWAEYTSNLRMSFWDSLARVANKYHKIAMMADLTTNAGYACRENADFDNALIRYKNALAIREKLKDPLQTAKGKYELATLYKHFVKYDEAMRMYAETESYCREQQVSKYLSYCFNDMAMIALQRGQTNYAIGKFHDALTLQERIRDTLGITSALNNIATIYFKQGSPTKAIEYFERSLRLHRIKGNREGVVRISANLSTVYSMMKEFDKALGLAKLCLEFREKENDPTELALCYNQIGSIYKRMGRPEESMKFFQKSLALYEQLQNPIELSHVNYNISFLYLEKKEYAMAGKHALKSLKLAQEVRNPDNVSRAAQVLYSVAKARGDSKTALEMFEIHITARDSLYNEQTRKTSIRSQLKYEYEKQAAADSVARAKERDVKNAELARRNAEIRAKKNQQYALFGGLGLVMVFAGFMFNRFKITQKQKKIIEQQKSEVEEQKKLVELKQKEVLDSIRYAKRIQMAHMAGERIIAQALMRMRRE